MKRFLHVGAFRDGRIVDERYVPEKGEVTVGKSADALFALLGAKLPPKYTLVTFEHQHPVLHVTAGMNGELALDGKSKQPLEALRSKGKANGNDWTLELPDTVRGWVSVGEASFFLQVASKPPPPPRNTLPRMAQGGFMSGLDKTFTTIFVVALAIESSAIVGINLQPHVDPDAPASAEDLDRFAEIIMPDKKPEQPKEEKKDEAKPEEKKEEAKKEPKKNESAEEKAAKHASAVKDAVAHSTLLTVLGSAGGGGALADVFNKGAFSSDINDALSGGVKIADSGDSTQHKGAAAGEGGVVGIGDIGNAASGSPHGTGLAEKKHVAPQIQVDDGDVDVESSSVDKDALNKFVKFRLRSVQSCYEKELRLNPTLKGKIVVRFTVTTQGRVGDASIDSDSMHAENVSSCIVRLIKTWIFPFKPEEDVPVSFPFVFQPGG
jgi:TonB family protein